MLSALIKSTESQLRSTLDQISVGSTRAVWQVRTQTVSEGFLVVLNKVRFDANQQRLT